ncbi:myopalladin [Halichoeres trimaculatus]|uniref:myopalladin n=1 Tax=Halichoeres trimaculatus TaxID=147232 RepID=UPI003D9E6847
MQEPQSLSQFLRESYMAEARAGQMSHPDVSSSHLQIHGALTEKVEDSLGYSDPHFPDLSAFLSQEELDESVNLACQAIRHEPPEETTEIKTSIMPKNIPASSSSREPPFVSLANHAPVLSADPEPLAHPAPECTDLLDNHKKWTADCKESDASCRDSIEVFSDFAGPVRNAPYGLETQSKKEFLNKAADFIEELSSLFKANSTKRVRPRACKNHRNKSQNKIQNDETVCPLSHENRERAVIPVMVKKERPSPVPSFPPKFQMHSESGRRECTESRTTERYKGETFPQEVKVEADSPVLTPPPMCEPPQFIQKLKSREVPEGHKVQLDCTVKGLPSPEVRWFCEGKELEYSPNIQIIANGNLHSMVIAEAFEEDTGRYSCFASNCYGTDSTSAEIYVEGASSSDSEGEHFGHVAQLQRNSLPPSSGQTLAKKESCPTSPPVSASERTPKPLSSLPVKPPLQESPLPVQTTASILLVPELSKKPVASSVHQEEEEEEEEEEVAVEPLESSGGRGLLEAQDVSMSVPVSAPPSAVSTATVKAPALPLSSVTLSVLPAPTLTPQRQSQTLNNTQHSHRMTEKPLTAAPVFTKGLQELLAPEGQMVVLKCCVKGLPSPQVDWYRDGKLLGGSPDFQIHQNRPPRSGLHNDDVCSLVIARVCPEDSGVFTCTASNPYGTTTSTALLRVTASGSSSLDVRPLSSLTAEPQIPKPFPSADPANLPLDVNTAHSIKPYSKNTFPDPFSSSSAHLEPFSSSTLCLDPNSSSMMSPDPLFTRLDPAALSSSYLNLCNTSTKKFDSYSPQGPLECRKAEPGPVSSQALLYQKPFTSSGAVGTSAEQEVPRPSVTSANRSLKVNLTVNSQNGSPITVPLPDPPPNSCLKTGTLTKQKNSRSSSRVGLRVHFKLPEDEPTDISSQSDEDPAQVSLSKEPPPVLAKPKLDSVQLQLLHNQVLLEQQQETEHQTQSHVQADVQAPIRVQSEAQSFSESSLWSAGVHREPPPPSSPPGLNNTLTLKQTPVSAPPAMKSSARPLSSAPAPRITVPDLVSASAPSGAPPAVPQLKTSMPVTAPPPPPQLESAPFVSVLPVKQANRIQASHPNLSSAALSVTPTTRPYFPPPALELCSSSADPAFYLQHTTSSPVPVLKSTHASLPNLSAISSAFSYTRPKEFIAAQTFSPVRSPSPNESPVPLLQELAAELNSSAASSPTLPMSPPPPGTFPVRVLRSPTSPPFLTSPLPAASFLNSVISSQLPPKASSPISSSSTPSPIQNPVAFLSSVLPSLTPSQPTNSMGLPRGAPRGVQKKVPKPRPQSEDGSGRGELFPLSTERKLQSSGDNLLQASVHQQKLSNKGKTGSRPLGPNIPATVINFDEEYRVTSFEQRLMSEIEFRLERTPVEESDDEVQHDDIPTGKCIAPIFEKKLRNYRAMEGVPVTFSCKVMGIPVPKVYWFKDGMQVLRKNVHYKKIREGDGTCALHIESTTNDDDGNYTVMAANPQGRISCSGHLIVQMGPPRNRMTPFQPKRVQVCIQEVESQQTQERFFQPHFLQAPGDMLAHEGRLCRLDCKVSGLPVPELMWLVNERPIYPDLHHKMLVRENGIHSLVIDPLMQNDSGTYTCIASNKAGQSSFSLELKVVEKEQKHPPTFVERLQNSGIPEGAPIRLECRVVGMPPPVIFWKKDNDTIPKTKDRISMTQDATGYVCLLIQPTTKDDAGWYTVSAKNEAGVVSCTCRLDIYAQWHQSVPAPVKKSTPAGSRYVALTGQGIDIRSVFPTSWASPILYTTAPSEANTESEEL